MAELFPQDTPPMMPADPTLPLPQFAAGARFGTIRLHGVRRGPRQPTTPEEAAADWPQSPLYRGIGDAPTPQAVTADGCP